MFVLLLTIILYGLAKAVIGMTYGEIAKEKTGISRKEKWSDLWYIFKPKNFDITLAEMDEVQREERRKTDDSYSAIDAFAKWYESGEYTPLEREHYIELVANALQYFHKDTVIARLTGDGVADDLLAPEWSRKKTTVINDIDKYLFAHNMWQGKKFE